MYSDHLPRYLAYFPLGEKLHIIDGDNFALKPWEEVGLVEKFLSLPSTLSNSSSFHHNSKESKKKLFCWDLIGKNTTREHCLEAERGFEHPKLSEDVEDKLRDFLQPYNEKLFEMVGQTFDWHNYH